MRNFETSNIRNISLLGHRGSGKTTLVESILYISKTLDKKGTVEDATTYPQKLCRLRQTS